MKKDNKIDKIVNEIYESSFLKIIFSYILIISIRVIFSVIIIYIVIGICHLLNFSSGEADSIGVWIGLLSCLYFFRKDLIYILKKFKKYISI